MAGESRVMAMVDRWSGRSARALREAKRVSVREFASELGVTDATVSNWERRGDQVRLRYETQQILDTCLKKAAPEIHSRFERLLMASDASDRTRPEPLETATHVRHPGDGKLMALVGEGVSLLGPDNEPVFLPAFYIDVYPTSNADYSRFIAATGHRPPAHWPDGTCPQEISNHPVVFVTWHDARAYAEWAGKQLPTKQQWEKAARGVRGDVYPWGSQPTPAKCNVRENALGTTTPVDRYHSGVSPYGVYDMCGNVWEWCSTGTTAERYELKGSAFTSQFSRAAPTAFNDASANMSDDDTGFRCAATTAAVETLSYQDE